MWKAVTELLLFKSVLQLYYASAGKKAYFQCHKLCGTQEILLFSLFICSLGRKKVIFFKREISYIS